MSSQVKVESTLIPKVFKDEIYLTQIGVARFQWTIKNFMDVSHCFEGIRSSGFSIDVLDRKTMEDKSQWYHLEMEFPKNKLPFPVYLLQSSSEKPVLAKISLESYAPIFSGNDVSLETAYAFQLSSNNKKRIVNVDYVNNAPEEVTFEIEVTFSKLNSSANLAGNY
jgi:hypothetical protein